MCWPEQFSKIYLYHASKNRATDKKIVQKPKKVRIFAVNVIPYSRHYSSLQKKNLFSCSFIFLLHLKPIIYFVAYDVHIVDTLPVLACWLIHFRCCKRRYYIANKPNEQDTMQVMNVNVDDVEIEWKSKNGETLLLHSCQTTICNTMIIFSVSCVVC